MERHQLTTGQVRVGTLLAEGGEGRVYTVVGQPDIVYKAYRRPPRRAPLEDLVSWLEELRSAHPELADRVRRATAWPTAVVTESVGDRAAGLLMPRAPERFTLRHRDGPPRLATLSYLTTDPAQRAAAYGLRLPDAVTPARLGVIYALARLLEANEGMRPAIGHGDLSGKNVLWSLARGPEIFVLDCDNSERFDPTGRRSPSPTDHNGDRRRAMTPNWDDPAVAAGGNPGRASDRYSLALIFLRVLGAAHYPLQRRQRAGQPIIVDFEIPPQLRRVAALGEGAALWDVCQRGLSVSHPELRPSPAAWVEVLEDALRQLEGDAVIASVKANQGAETLLAVEHPAVETVGPGPTADVFAGGDGETGEAGQAGDAGDAGDGGDAGDAGDVIVRPVGAELRFRRWSRIGAQDRGPRVLDDRMAAVPAIPAWSGRTGSAVAGTVGSGTIPPAIPSANGAVWPQVRAQISVAVAWWLLLHRRMIRALRSAGRRRLGVRRLAFCVVVDLAVASVALFLVAMVVSPFLGI